MEHLFFPLWCRHGITIQALGRSLTDDQSVAALPLFQSTFDMDW